MSGYLHKLKPGDTLKLSLPEGIFTPPVHGDRNVVCIASGIGVTPFVGYLEALARLDSDMHPPRIRLLIVCRNGRSHPFARRLRQLAAQLPTVRMQVHYTAPEKEDQCPQDYDYSGRPNFKALDPAITQGRPLVYLCGPDTFLENARGGLLAQGVPSFDIFSETFITHTEVSLTHEPHEVRISGTKQAFVWKPEAGTLLDAAEAAGIALPSGCRVGQCESCAMHIVSGTVAHLSPYDGPSDQCLTCQAIPTTTLELQI